MKVASTKAFQNVLQSIKKNEGLKLNPYKCTSNKLTIGYGRNLENNGITEAEAHYLLLNDVYLIENELDRLFKIKKMPNHVYEVLVEMAYQLGIEGLLKFKKTLVLVEAGEYKLASKEMMRSKWAEQTPARACNLAIKMYGG
jgi:lysozyme